MKEVSLVTEKFLLKTLLCLVKWSKPKSLSILNGFISSQEKLTVKWMGSCIWDVQPKSVLNVVKKEKEKKSLIDINYLN